MYTLSCTHVNISGYPEHRKMCIRQILQYFSGSKKVLINHIRGREAKMLKGPQQQDLVDHLPRARLGFTISLCSTLARHSLKLFPLFPAYTS